MTNTLQPGADTMVSKISPLKLLGCACGAAHYKRQRRSLWMRFIPAFRLYFCSGCESTVFALKEKERAFAGQRYYAGYAGHVPRSSYARGRSESVGPTVVFQGESFKAFVTQLMKV